jgi:methionyl-tRNA formyltransferase
MLPEAVWNMPKLGTINLHASLLPNYRGAAPINWVLINGEKQTGVTTFFLEHQIDTGAILLQETIDIGDDENLETLHNRLMEKGANLVLQTVKLIESGRYTSIPQAKLIDSESEFKSAPKIFKEDTQINWNNSCENIYNHIRGLSPYPGAYTTLIVSDSISIVLKIYTSLKRIENHNYTPGRIISDQKFTMSIACVDGWIDVIELQQQGKKRMGIKAFLAGFNYSEAYCK